MNIKLKSILKNVFIFFILVVVPGVFLRCSGTTAKKNDAQGRSFETEFGEMIQIDNKVILRDSTGKITGEKKIEDFQ